VHTYDGTGELDVDELEEGWGVESGVDEAGVVDGGRGRGHGWAVEGTMTGSI
jgi:hypothetical protein